MVLWALILHLLFAQELQERSIEVTTTQTNPVLARKELMDQAIEKLSEEMIKSLIGEAKFNRNRAKIKTQILNQSGRYIPVTKASDMSPLEPGFSMRVHLRVSNSNLEKLLLENGLFYESDGTPLIMSFIHFVDRVQMRSYAWWNPSSERNTALGQFSFLAEQSLRQSLQKNNFYLLPAQAQKYADSLAASEQVEGLRLEDQQSLAQKYSAQIFIQGRVSLESSRSAKGLQWVAHLSALQVSNGRSLGEVFRQVDLGSNPKENQIEKKLREMLDPVAQEISAQIVEAWQKGSFGSELYRFRLAGRLNPAEREAARAKLQALSKEIKNVRERLLAPDFVVFEFEASKSPETFAAQLPPIQIGAKAFQFDGVQKNEIIFKLQR